MTQLVQDFIKEKLNGKGQISDDPGRMVNDAPAAVAEGPPDEDPEPAPGDEVGDQLLDEGKVRVLAESVDGEVPAYLAPRDSDTELKAVCKKILGHLDACQGDYKLTNVGYIESLIRATGVKA